MAANRAIVLDVPSGNGSGEAADIYDCWSVTFFVSGPKNADVQIEISPDGYHWIPYGSKLTGGNWGVVQLTTPAFQARVTITNWVSTPDVQAIGMTSLG